MTLLFCKRILYNSYHRAMIIANSGSSGTHNGWCRVPVVSSLVLSCLKCQCRLLKVSLLSLSLSSWIVVALRHCAGASFEGFNVFQNVAHKVLQFVCWCCCWCTSKQTSLCLLRQTAALSSGWILGPIGPRIQTLLANCVTEQLYLRFQQ